MSSSPLVSRLVKNRLYQTASDIDEPPFQFIHSMDLSVVDTMLHDSPDLVIHRTEIWAVWRPQVGRKKVWRFLMQQFNCCTCTVRCVGALSCWNTKLLTDTRVYRWQQYDVIMTSWSSMEGDSKRYHQNFLLCNNNEISACIADLLNSFCEALYVVAFCKVVQQQTIGKVGNSITYLWEDNFCLNTERIIKIGNYLRKLCSNEIGSSFFIDSVD